MKFQKNDIVTIGVGHVHWTVLEPGDLFCNLESQMTGRRRSEPTSNLEFWKPEARHLA